MTDRSANLGKYLHPKSKKVASRATEKIRGANLAENKARASVERKRAEGRAEKRLYPPDGLNTFSADRKKLK